ECHTTRRVPATLAPQLSDPIHTAPRLCHIDRKRWHSNSVRANVTGIRQVPARVLPSARRARSPRWSICCRGSFLFLPFFLSFFFSHPEAAMGTEGLTVGTCFGSIENRTFSLQGYMDVFTPGPETSPERQARSLSPALPAIRAPLIDAQLDRPGFVAGAQS